MDRLSEMEAFVQVVDHGGFTEAGRRLGVSKSAISKHVASLEARLGARLLDRTTRRVGATDIGLAYYERAVRILADAAEADAMAETMQGSPKGELRLSAPMSFGRLHLGPAITTFLRRYPDVEARIDLDDRFVEIVAEGFDLAIRIGALVDSSLRARKLSTTRMHLVAAPSYLARHGAPQSCDELADHALMHYAQPSVGSVWRLQQGRQVRELRVRGRLSVNNGDALLQAAEDGLGVCMAPAFICGAALDAGRVVDVLPAAAPPPLDIWAIYPEGRFQQPKLRVFVDHLVETFRGRGPDWR